MHNPSTPIWVLGTLLWTVVVTALANQACATVTWSFYETAIIICSGAQCVPPPQPYVVATLMLPSPTSVGTATWLSGNPILPGDPPPAHSGNDFTLNFSDDGAVSSSNLIGPPG